MPLTELLILIGGMIGLWIGAGLTVDGAQRIANDLKISHLFIGLTVLSIGTSLPEIFTHIAASINILNGVNASGIAIGTNIGSNILQITFILGMIGILTVIKSSPKIQKRDGLVMLGAIALLWLVGLNGVISRFEGAFLVILYIIYIYGISRDEDSIKELVHPHHKMVPKKRYHILVELGVVVIGLVLLGISATYVVSNARFLAKVWRIEQAFIGIFLIGVSTALPELTTALMGVIKGAKEMSLGVLIGSNITNPMFALGIGAAISGLTIANSLEYFDIPIWFGVSVLGLLFFTHKHFLEKKEAVVLMAFYFVYLGLRFMYF